MLYRFLVGLSLCGAFSSTSALAQAVPAPHAPADSLILSAQQDGRVTARQQGTGGYFASSFAGGFLAGLLGPVTLLLPEPLPLALSGAGAGVMIVSTKTAADRDSPLPPALREPVETRPPEYREAFGAAYREHLRARRIRASLWGGATGTGVGFVALMLLASGIDF